MKRIAVVGASLAGVRAAQALRRRGFDGSLVLIGDEAHAPYDRPPLSKQFLRAECDVEQVSLRDDGFDALGVELRLGVRATALHGATRTLSLSDGSELAADGLVIATGARARQVAAVPALEGVYTLRTLDDARALRDALQRAPRVVILGAGFIGLEVAASCRALGLSVTVVESLALPLATKLGEAMGRVVADLHRDRGVDLRCGVSIAKVMGAGRVEAVLLNDGTQLPADLLLVGVGAMPNTEWLRGSGVALGDGVLCDDRCATNVPGVVAAGDVARWSNPLYGESMRVEHWTNASEQADAAVARLLEGAEKAQPFSPVPHFWSDQYDRKLQFSGRASDKHEVSFVENDLRTGKLLALCGQAGRLTGVLSINRAAKHTRLLPLLRRPTSFADALAAAR